VSILDEPRRRILAFTDLVQFGHDGRRRSSHLCLVGPSIYKIKCSEALMTIAKVFGWLPNMDMNRTSARPTNCHMFGGDCRPAVPMGLRSSRIAR
jgi:hypothetical protein